jgi:pSer/pThr/pTyr-binding forkhead associated (FHA) protein
MAKLILSLDGMVIREYPLTKERTTLGRKPHNDIVIDNLAISGEHAMIMTILNDSFLEDLGSTNGTLVNGQPVKKHFLQNNDVVELGKYKLKYVTEATVAQASPADFEKTMVLRAPVGASRQEPARDDFGAHVAKNFSDTVVNPDLVQTQGSGLREAVRQQAADSLSPAPAAPVPTSTTAAPVAPPTRPAVSAATTTTTGAGHFSAGAQIQGTIQILSGPSAGKELPLTKALTTLGKPGVQVAVIAKRPQGYFITHVEGLIFPVVNGKLLDAQAHGLNDHDVIELAGVKMEFYLKPSS